ncbi:hypothetical protein ACEPAI_2113 [Sanghuangporus weigelae]
MFSTPCSCSAVAFLAFSAYLTHALVVRDVSSSTPGALAAEASTISTSDAPFFTSGGFTGQSDGGQQPEDRSQRDVTETALEWMSAIIAIVAITSFTTWRCMHLKRRNQSLRSFFSQPRGDRTESRDNILTTQERRQSLPRTTGLPRPHTLSGSSMPVTASFFYPPCLTHGPYPEPLEPAPAHLARSVSLPGFERGRRSERRSRRAARGADIDAHGRRGGQPDVDNRDGHDKEELPAYESVAVDGPPRYADVDVQYVGGLPVRVVTLPMTVPEARESRESLEGERTVERALQHEVTRESSSPSSLDRREAREVGSESMEDASAPSSLDRTGARLNDPSSS